MHVSYIYEGRVPSRLAAFIQILNTGRALCERGVPVTLYTDILAAPNVAECLRFYGLLPHPHLRIRPLARDGWRRLTYPWRLHRIMRERRSDDRHVIMSRGEPGVALFRRLRRMPWPSNVRFVYEAHRPCFTQVGRWHGVGGALGRSRRTWAAARMRASEGAVVERADGVVCLTEGVRDALAGFFALGRQTLVLPSGTSPPPPTLPDDDERDIDVFYAGKLSTRKGIDDLIRALRFLPGARCWIAGGSGEDVAALRAKVEAEGVADRVTLLGFVSPGKVRALYERARVGVCPLPEGVSPVSERYTSPMKILDMMTLGAPVVATDLPSTRELLEHGKTALLAPPSNPRALAAAIQRLLDDRGLAAQLADAARKEVERYTWNERARHLHDFLRSLP